MLCNNTWTFGGLVNELFGTVRAILYDENVTSVILVEFNDHNEA